MASAAQAARVPTIKLDVVGLPPDRKLTFSMGAVAKTMMTDQTEELIQRADRALYRAKEAGRDRLEVA